MMDITEVLGVEVLPELSCFSCNSLLSISPILMDAEGKNFCGRCALSNEGRAYVHNIHYENVARLFSFPCRFVNEGCTVKKCFNDIKYHEKNCFYQIMDCPVKTCIWSGIATELILHFNLHHENLKMDNNCSRELLGNEGCFLLVANNFYFSVVWSVCESNFHIKVDSLNFINSDAEVKFDCYVMTSDLKTVAKIIPHLDLETSTTLNMCDLRSPHLIFSINAVLSTDIINNKLEELKKIKCPSCLRQMVSPILKCPKGHVTCLDCTGADYDFCSQCVEDELLFTRMRDLELLTVSLLYSCRWENCGIPFSFKQIRTHEQGCIRRIFMCIHCFQWYGFFDEISSHDDVCKSKKILCPLIKDSQVSVLGTDINGMLEYLLLAFKEMFWVIIKPTESGINIYVNNFGPVSTLGWYRYEADLLHVEDMNCPFNETYQICNKNYNAFTVDVPDSNTANFGGSQFFKIIVKIISLNDDEKSETMALILRKFG